MLEQKQKDVLTLIRSALNKEKKEQVTEVDLDYVYEIAKQHQIFGLLFYGLENCGLKNSEIYQKLFLKACQSISVSQRQMRELDTIFALFEKEKIDYMPLKGAVLKQLYPKHDMRLMGDADILIRTKDYDKIKGLLEWLGYTEGQESDHELVWIKPELYLELHKSVMPKRDKRYYAYFGDGWDNAVKSNDIFCRYRMSDEMTFIFLFVHFVKHYAGAGIGIKHMVDLWVYQNSKPNLDKAFVLEEMKKLGLAEFYENIMHTLKAWFGETEFNQKDEFVTKVIFDNGVFGNMENVTLSSMKDSNAKTAKLKRFISLVFLPYSSMAYIFPVLKKAPILLPVFWVVRAFNSVFIKKKRIKAEFKTINNLSNEKLQSYIQSLDYVGLKNK